MKVLCMCAGAVSRSVGLAYLLKYRYGHDALAVSHEKNTVETIDMLSNWADRIIVVQPHYAKHIPEKYHSKLGVYDVGLDRWVNALHPELHQVLETYIAKDTQLVNPKVESGE